VRLGCAQGWCFKSAAGRVDVRGVDLWDWLGGLVNLLLDRRWGLRLALAALLLCCVVIWLEVPYFRV
jgi:hypothetical protein